MSISPAAISEPLVLALGEVAAYPSDPARRLFWGFLLSSALIALLVSRARGIGFAQSLRAAVSRQFWFHRTHLVDVGLLLFNALLRMTLLVPLFGSHLVATLLVARFWQAKLGSAPDLELSWLVVTVTFTGVFFLIEDASRFGLHVLMHRVPFLWRFHRVHHSASRLTPLTLFRVHPAEMMLYYLRGLVVFGVVSGSFVYLFGSQLSALEILGVDALGFLFNLLGANLRHSHIWWSFGGLERCLISPAQHQLHHSSALAHQGRNYGTCLAIWDRWLGSWLPAAGPRQTLNFGLAPDAAPARDTVPLGVSAGPAA